MVGMDYTAFKRQVKDAGCDIQEETKHSSSIYYQGEFVSTFCRTHGRGAKDIILPPYVKAFKTGLEAAQKRSEAKKPQK